METVEQTHRVGVSSISGILGNTYTIIHFHFASSTLPTGRFKIAEEFENNMDEDSQSGSQLNAAGAKDLIDKVRAAIRAFGKSAAASNESPSSARGSRRQLKLKLDGRANWTSTLRMLKGCLEHERALRLFLEEGVAKPCSLLDDDFEAISVIVRALDHVEEARGRLLLSDGNMESADMALQVGFSVLLWRKS